MVSLKSLKQRQSGFTIVELLIVIVVIGILALLVITTYSGIQQKARNAKRQTDVASLQTQIEAYYQTAGFYPNLTDINSATWRATNMKSLDVNALIDPSSSCNPASASCLAATPAAKTYAFAATDASGAACDGAVGSGADATCAKYTLTGTFEGQVNNQSTVVKTNLD
jgi:prepilin-type N-terminal cleavage/methylation domain-containing protein